MQSTYKIQEYDKSTLYIVKVLIIFLLNALGENSFLIAIFTLMIAIKACITVQSNYLSNLPENNFFLKNFQPHVHT